MYVYIFIYHNFTLKFTIATLSLTQRSITRNILSLSISFSLLTSLLVFRYVALSEVPNAITTIAIHLLRLQIIFKYLVFDVWPIYICFCRW